MPNPASAGSTGRRASLATGRARGRRPPAAGPGPRRLAGMAALHRFDCLTPPPRGPRPRNSMLRPLLLLATLALVAPAHAETVNCIPINSLPATLTTQGVYCLKQDLSTPIATGNAITVAVNNVTLDCNGYKLGGLAAGSATRTNGVFAQDRLNVVVRNCNIRGFYAGVWMQGGASHVVEGNRMEGNTYAGVGVFNSDG